jgi:DNA-binding IclR family transcriptional regulator
MLREKRVQTIQTTDKALELLQLVASGEKNLKINDLAHTLKISKEEVLLLLVTMESRGLVSWDNRKKMYQPGCATLEMAINLVQRFSRFRPLQSAASLR